MSTWVMRTGPRWTDMIGSKTMLRDSFHQIQKSASYLMRSATTNNTTIRTEAMNRT